MTSLVSWAGVDSRATASIYIATDSRISWGQGSTWDAGRKVFASRSRPEVFGYVGDVLFPSLVLGQIADAIETPNPAQMPPPETRFGKIRELIKAAFESLPSDERRPFRIGYGVRIGDGMHASFHFFSLRWDQLPVGWSSNQEQLPTSSDSIVIWGSGASSIELWKKRWDRSSQKSTSRAIFSSLCDAIGSGRDPKSGGAPQLVGLYRLGSARTIGIVHGRQPYVFGLPADRAGHQRDGLVWRNHLVEGCDLNGARLESAQQHHAPRGLGESARIQDR